MNAVAVVVSLVLTAGAVAAPVVTVGPLVDTFDAAAAVVLAAVVLAAAVDGSAAVVACGDEDDASMF